jgi:hypothetical protein
MNRLRYLTTAACLSCLIAAAGLSISKNLTSTQSNSGSPRNSPLATSSNNASDRDAPQEVVPKKDDEHRELTRIVEEKNFDLPELRRKALKIVIGDRKSDTETLRSALLEVAKRQDADTVMVYGFLSGEDPDKAFPAGILEFGKNGRNWCNRSTLPPDGVFQPREAHQEGNSRISTATPPGVPPSGIEAAARAYTASEPPDKTVAEKDHDAAVGLISKQQNISEQTVRSMDRLDQARLAVKSLANTLGMTENEVLRMSSSERQEAMVRHLSQKYGVSESDTRRAMRILGEN